MPDFIQVPALEGIVDRLRIAFAATAEHYDRTASFPFENFDRLSDAGLLALTVPRKFGGAGAGLADAVAVVGGIARGEPSTALVLAMQYA
ncbi:acyl-CoA dehydrogenase family protein, partial [Salmonella enterica]|uniref:acyl-CoA dehydrogenase family protein n=1 Tax=Salmonella enterica TaxID=28901 RepID=UPI001910C5F8